MIFIGVIILALGDYVYVPSISARGIPLVAEGGSIILIRLITLAIQQIKSAYGSTQLDRIKDKIAVRRL
ncbi:hypothetical protein CLAVI_000435 [Candidatus Clavichlamydia salmonicola]|uniref:hypothetical protein n=1 Tax=Candidatus Clavichlamydia salmonicola TaxID=469812 RepID=UPI001890DB1B|nr:hypothetical protein [Candidatus Clavichlamydia salmonicola]MBF5050816.1 hypothetical protein [Candidatus Clavichlamydia salmonicola]